MLHQGLRKFMIAFMLLIVGNFVAPVDASAQSPSNMSFSEQMRLENIKEFNNWRKTIPDLEKRQYDRIKKLNSRTIRLTNLVIALLVLGLIGISLTIYLIILISRGHPFQSAPTLPHSHGAEVVPRNFENESKKNDATETNSKRVETVGFKALISVFTDRRTRAILRCQKKLETLAEQLIQQQFEADERANGLSKTIALVRGEIKKINAGMENN